VASDGDGRSHDRSRADEGEFRARLARSGQLHDGILDLAVDVGGDPADRIQTFVPPYRVLAPGTFDLRIGLRGEARGKGYGREAVALLTDWLFERAGGLLVEACTDPANHPMRAVFRRIGWHEDGMLPEIGRDWLMYRITRQQWQALRGWHCCARRVPERARNPGESQ
jgi:RimJ/RimL family protein N-acetyltransferase